MVNTTVATKTAARGFSRWYRRQGVRKNLAVQYTLTRYPEFARLEADIGRGQLGHASLAMTEGGAYVQREAAQAGDVCAVELRLLKGGR